MSRALVRKKNEGRQAKAVVKRKKKQAASKTARRAGRLKASSTTKPSLQKKRGRPVKKAARAAKPVSPKGRRAGKRRQGELDTTQAGPMAPSPLLRKSKTTSAALSLLEKGIRFIYQKDFRKARQEFSFLLENHPEEHEILARVRSYLQICDREETAHRKQSITNDQLYTLGVLDHNRGNYERAISYFHQSLEKRPNADYIYYSLAASMAMAGDVSNAIRNLQKSIDLNGENRIYARNDADFSSLITQKEFVELVSLSQESQASPRKDGY